TLRVLAKLWRDGSIPEGLRHLRKKSEIEPLVSLRMVRPGDPSYPSPYHDETAAGQTLQRIIAGSMTDEEKAAAAKGQAHEDLQVKIRDLGAQKIEGYFPTPKDVVLQMIGAAYPINPEHKVLEPSAGTGNIADAIREEEPLCQLLCWEIR